MISKPVKEQTILTSVANLLASVILALVLVSNAFAETNVEAIDKSEAVKQVVEQSVQNLLLKYNKELPYFETDPDRFLREMDIALTEIVDFRRIAARVMGKYARKASKEQKNRFVNIFKKSLYSTYTTTLVETGVEKINVTKAKINTRSDKKASVDLSVISDNGTVFPVVYSMYKTKDGKWLLENVIVFGVNVGLAFRDRFEQQYRKQKGNIDAVIDGWKLDLNIKQADGKNV